MRLHARGVVLTLCRKPNMINWLLLFCCFLHACFFSAWFFFFLLFCFTYSKASHIKFLCFRDWYAVFFLHAFPRLVFEARSSFQTKCAASALGLISKIVHYHTENAYCYPHWQSGRERESERETDREREREHKNERDREIERPNLHLI